VKAGIFAVLSRYWPAILSGRLPDKIIGDKAYDSDKLDAELMTKHEVEIIAPPQPKTQDGRKLRRYKRRWKVERLFAWLQNFRRLVVRYKRHADN
jgi:transposase